MNELMDVKNVNLPDFSKGMEVEKEDWFIFAGMTKPGYH